MRRSILSIGLALACVYLGAAPFSAAQEKAAAVEVAPAPSAPAETSSAWQEAAVIPALATGDCAEKQLAGDPPIRPKCGFCSLSPCANANLYSACGSSGGQAMRCMDDSLDVCTDSRPMCICRTGPI